MVFHQDTLSVGQTEYHLENWIVAATFSLVADNKQLESSAFQLNARAGVLKIIQPPDSVKLFIATYFALPIDLQLVYRHHQLVKPDSASEAVSEFLGNLDPVTGDHGRPYSPFGQSKLQHSGSISRAVIAGNRKNLSLESGLRINLSGEIAENVTIEAVLTDQNIPIQPDGTTQRLNDLDQVYIRINTPIGRTALGDVDLRFTGSQFANFSRKLQGLQVQSAAFSAGGIRNIKVEAAGAVARGNFQSQKVLAVDGVQGPYRLTGTQGEPFIIVIAGTEKVFIDGQLLKRGETEDYVIDYAAGEITFTAKQLITEQHRIQVDFEYAINAFSRTLLGTNASLGFGGEPDEDPKLTLNFTYLREADNPRLIDEAGLTSADSLALSLAGDAEAFRSGAFKVPFNAEAIYVQYALVDTVFGGSIYQIYAPVTAEMDTVFRVRFTRRPAGDYNRSGDAVNGIVYRWVGPNQGQYQPIRVLQAPRKQQLIDFNADYHLTKYLRATSEFAQSFTDQNLLSGLDDGDNSGIAFKAGLVLEKLPVIIGQWEGGALSAGVNYNQNSASFTSFERIFPVEVERQWNLDRALPITGGIAVNSTEANIDWDISALNRFKFDAGKIDLAGGFSGQRLSTEIKIGSQKGPQLSSRFEAISSTDSLLQQSGSWLRNNSLLKWQLLDDQLVPALEVVYENRQQKAADSDSLYNSSLRFLEFRPAVNWESDKMSFGAFYTLRNEDAPAENSFIRQFSAQTVGGRFGIRAGRWFSSEGSLGFRKKSVSQYFKENEALGDQESVVVSLNSNLNPWKRAVSIRWRYEAHTERTPLLQETYILVGPELGQYVWTDFNDDNIRQVDEFLPEQTALEGTYIRSFVPSDELLPIINVKTRLQFRLDPKRIWKSADNLWLRRLSLFSTTTTLNISEKSSSQTLSDIYLLRPAGLQEDSTTINGQIRFSQDLNFRRGNPKGNARLYFTQMKSLNRLAAGQESRFVNNWVLDINFRPLAWLGFKIEGKQGINRSESAFDSRSYDISQRSLSPEVQVLAVRNLQFTAGGIIDTKTDNQSGTPITATQFRIPVTLRLSQIDRLQVNFTGEYANIRLNNDDVVQGLTAYTLTDGRGAGKSWRWALRGDYIISQYLKASFNYDGRSPAGAPTVHTVRMEVSATF